MIYLIIFLMVTPVGRCRRLAVTTAEDSPRPADWLRAACQDAALDWFMDL